MPSLPTTSVGKADPSPVSGLVTWKVISYVEPAMERVADQRVRTPLFQSPKAEMPSVAAFLKR